MVNIFIYFIINNNILRTTKTRYTHKRNIFLTTGKCGQVSDEQCHQIVLAIRYTELHFSGIFYFISDFSGCSLSDLTYTIMG